MLVSVPEERCGELGPVFPWTRRALLLGVREHRAGQGPVARPGSWGRAESVEVCRTGPGALLSPCGFLKGRVRAGAQGSAEWNEDFTCWWVEGERVVQRGSSTERTSKVSVDVGGPELPWQPVPRLVIYGKGIAPWSPLLHLWIGVG